MTGPNLRIELERTKLQPGDEIRGTVFWEADDPVEALELRLAWQTEGKGNPSSAVAHEDRLEKPGSRGEQTFSFDAPESPYSFSGKLISLVWRVGVRLLPGGENVWETITLSPTGEEIALHQGMQVTREA